MKEQILKTAADLFLTLGFKSVTMDDIAQAMGISKKTIYAHYSTKTKLIEATALFVIENIKSGLLEIKNQDKDPIEELYAMKEFTMAYLKDEKSSPQFQLEKYFPEIYHEVHTNHLSIIHWAIKENLKKGIEIGWYRKDLPIEFTGKIYFIGVTGMNDPVLFPRTEGMKGLYKKFLEYHLRSIVTPKGLKKLEELLNTE